MKAPDKKKLKKDVKDVVVEKSLGAVVEDDAEEVQPTPPAKSFTASGVEIVEDISDEASPTETARQQSVAAVARISEDENVEIVFLEGLFDYPVIGNFNFRDKFGISTIRKHQKFTVPKHVAMVLVDRRLVTIPSMATV